MSNTQQTVAVVAIVAIFVTIATIFDYWRIRRRPPRP
jgi:hypothetical protein